MTDIKILFKSSLIAASAFLMILCVPIVGDFSIVRAQDVPPELVENGNQNNAEASGRRGRRDSESRVGRRQNNREDRVNRDRSEQKKRGIIRRILFRNKAPSEPDQWHNEVSLYNNQKKNDYFYYGYAQAGEEWFPVYIHRYFVMIKKQYEHTLVIKGRPENIPKVKGIRMSPYGLEIKNYGFEFDLPTFPSVDRQQKSLDEYEFRRIAEEKLLEFGFTKTIWLEDKTQKVKDMADTWRAN